MWSEDDEDDEDEHYFLDQIPPQQLPGNTYRQKRSILVRLMDPPPPFTTAEDGAATRAVVVPLLQTTGRPETFRQLLYRFKQLLVNEGFGLVPSDLQDYSRFTTPNGDLYLLDTPVVDCMENEDELRLVTDQQLNLKRKREEAEVPSISSVSATPPQYLQPQQQQQQREATARPGTPMGAATPAAPMVVDVPSLESLPMPSSVGLTTMTANPSGGKQQSDTMTTFDFLSDVMKQVDRPAGPSASPSASTASMPYKPQSPSSAHMPPKEWLADLSEMIHGTTITTALAATPPSTLPFSSLPPPSGSGSASTSTSTTTTTSPTSHRSAQANAAPGPAFLSADAVPRVLAEAQRRNPQAKLPHLESAKNELQSLFQAKLGPRFVPDYMPDRDGFTGAFTASVDISRIDDGRGIVGRGISSKKKDAEKLAALDALLKLQAQGGLITPVESAIQAGVMNPKTHLNLLFHERWRSSPTYTYSIDPATGHFTAELQVEGKVLRATSSSKAKASTEVAEKALQLLGS